MMKMQFLTFYNTVYLLATSEEGTHISDDSPEAACTRA